MSLLMDDYARDSFSGDLNLRRDIQYNADRVLDGVVKFRLGLPWPRTPRFF